MIVRWQDTKSGFVRNQNFLISRQSLLNNYHSVFSTIPVTPGLSTGIISVINDQDTAVLSIISSIDTGLSNPIDQNVGIISFISNEDTGITSEIS